MNYIATWTMVLERSPDTFADRFQRLAQQKDLGCIFRWTREWTPFTTGAMCCRAKCVTCRCRFKVHVTVSISFSYISFPFRVLILLFKGLDTGTTLQIKIWGTKKAPCPRGKLPPRIMWTIDHMWEFVESFFDCETAESLHSQGMDGAKLESSTIADLKKLRMGPNTAKQFKRRFECFL